MEGTCDELRHTLKVAELEQAKNVIISHLQREYFPEYQTLVKMSNPPDPRAPNMSQKAALKASSNLYRLDPYISDGVIKVGSRIKGADGCRELAHPIILPKAHHLTMLIARQNHEKTCHSRTTMLNEIRANGFWILQAVICCT